MAEKRNAYASQELASLEHANARLQAEVRQLQTDLEKSKQVNQTLSEELIRKEKVGTREKSTIADVASPPKTVEEFPDQLAKTAHAARLQNLGELSANLIHELNQPLTAIGTYAHAGLRLLSGGAVEEQEVTRLFDRIAGQADRAGELIRRIRRFANRSEPERTPVDLNETVREALLLTESEVQKHQVQTSLHLTEKIPLILVDRVQIVQVLVNLISNAVEAMHETPVSERLLTITTQMSDNEVQASVSDAGGGISLEMIRNLFEAFRSTKPNGMGLGLAISRSIVQAHNGRMWVKSNPQRGTTFFFAFLLSQT